MMALWQWLAFVISVAFIPPFTIGVIRKTKARLQNRIGAPLLQPFFNIIRLLRKAETISQTASWVFRTNTVLNISVALLVAVLVPWLSYKPSVPGDDLFLIVYLLALVRFFKILASLDTASPFGAFGASREATLAPLVEPAVVLSLVALAVPAHTSNLSLVFSFDFGRPLSDPALWMLAGTGLYLSSLVELSRMPVDDPTTHLELTMVHEAMTIENSGKNLALIDFGYALTLSVLFGLSSQCYLHALSYFIPLSDAARAILSIAGVLLMAVVTALIEGTTVKLQWRKVPEFIAYGLTMSLLATLVAIAQGVRL